MQRKLVGGGLVLVAALAAVYFLVLRGRGDDQPPPSSGSGRTAQIAPPKTTPAREAERPRGRAPQFTLDRDPEGPLQLEGQVLGPDGKGVGGAEVWLGSVPPRSAKSDDDGTFSFDKVVGRTYQLSAKSGELVGGPVTYKLTEKSDPVVIRLAEGATVVVTVVDDAEHPIAGAELRVGTDGKPEAQRTDAKGEATLKPVRPGYVAVSARAAGYAPGGGFTTIGSAGATGRLTIRLKRGFAVSGRVIDEAGKPVAKAHVTVGRGNWAEWGLDDDDGEDSDAAKATTDDKGQFAIAAVAAGTHTLNAVDGEHAPAQSNPVTVSDRAVTGVEIVMKAGGAVAGRVVDAQGKPVPFATVRVAGAGQMMWQVRARQATTEKDGTFAIRGLQRAKMSARAESDAAASKLADVDLIAKSEVKDLELVLDVVGTIAGKVIDDQGAPVAEVQVNAFPDILGGASTEGLALAGMSSATSNGAGEFTVHGLPDGAYKLWASRPTNSAFEWGQSGTSARTGDRSVVITLPAPGKLVGKVALSGRAPKLATVQVGYQPATPAQDGAFEVKELAPGSYDITFRGPEFAQLVKRDVKIEPGKTTDLGTIEVQRGRKLAGKVLDPSGKPVAGAKVKLGEVLFEMEGQDNASETFEDMRGIRTTTTDQDGAFALVGVPAKATSVIASHADFGRSNALPVPEGTEDPPALTLALRGFGSITGKVTQKGQPLGGVTVSVSAKGGGAQLTFARTDDAGNFRIAKAPEGTLVLQAMQTKIMAMKSTSATVEVTAGKESKVTIDMPVGQIAMTVQIKALPGHKVDAAQVFLFSGTVAAANGKQLTESFLAGGAQGMKIWLGKDAPMPEFDELLPGDFSVCTVPITGDLADPKFQARLNEQGQSLKVYCKQAKVPAAPLKQTVVQEVPSMVPLP